MERGDAYTVGNPLQQLVQHEIGILGGEHDAEHLLLEQERNDRKRYDGDEYLDDDSA